MLCRAQGFGCPPHRHPEHISGDRRQGVGLLSVLFRIMIRNMNDWPRRRRTTLDIPHPDSPAGRSFDWSSVGAPHPSSPAGRNFDYWSPLGIPHPNSPAGRMAFNIHLRQRRAPGFEFRATSMFDGRDDFSVSTSPNPIYVRSVQSRKGCVDPNAWNAALAKVGVKPTPTSKEAARKAFNQVREVYWKERLRLAAPGEFNGYNILRIKAGNAPIGPDGFSIELEHRELLSEYPQRALDPTNVFELFKRQHDFQHGDVGLRWGPAGVPKSPHEKELKTEFGDPSRYQQWP